MRVLFAPEIYGTSDYLEGQSTLTDMKNWAEAWLEQDDYVHIYWMLPRKQDIKYDDEWFGLDHDRVTVFRQRRYFQGTKFERIDSWREEQLLDLDEARKDNYAYFDVVVSQHSESQNLMWRTLHSIYDAQYTSVPPFFMVKHLHDFNAEDKGHTDRYRNNASVWGDLEGVAYMDRVWCKAEWDKENMLEHGRNYLAYDKVNEIDEKSLFVSSPMDFSSYNGEYSDEPKYIHLAGDAGVSKKNRDDAVEIAEKLYQRFDIEMIITSMGSIESKFKEKEFTDCYENCPYEVYKKQLDRGDIVLCPTKYETGGKTWFEQAASGQVFIAWERPWLYEYVDKDYPLMTTTRSDMLKLALWAVKNWDTACEKSKAMIEEVKEIRNQARIGQITREDMYALVDGAVSDYEPDWDEELLRKAMSDLNTPAKIDRIDKATEKYTDTGKPISGLFGYTLTDMIYCLRSLGYVDVGGEVPTFEKDEDYYG